MSTPSLKSLAFSDLDREITVTRRILERLPKDHYAWKVHEKSMSLGNLAMHVVNLLQWMIDTLAKNELDLATVPPPRTTPSDRADLLQTFDANAVAIKAALQQVNDASLAAAWPLRHGQE